MLLVISTMKNEAPFLLEWLAYHQSIGFERFLIYSNDCTDGTDHMLDRLDAMGHVTHCRNDVLRRGPHKSALKYAFEHLHYAAADWVYVTDADEFLNIRAGDGTVHDLISAYPDTDAIPVTWRLFSNNGETELPDGLIMETFTDAEGEVRRRGEKGRFVKSLFRPDSRIAKLGLHAPTYGEDVADDVRWGADPSEPDPTRPKHAFGYEVAQVNHYAVRSVDAYLLKKDRGRANHVNDTLGSEYWTRWNIGGTRDVSILDRLPAAKARMDEFLADEKLAFLHRAGKALAAQRLAELLRLPEYRDLREDLAGPSTPPAPKGHKANTELAAKAPKRHAKRQEMLSRMPKNGRCAEIGVWNGGFSHEILNITSPKELVLIDPWDLLAKQSSSEWNHKKHEDAKAMGEMFDNVERLYGDRKDVIIRKGFSAEVLESYPDDHFDWVYIDGNHQYEFVRKDVEVSFRKVRPGGIIAGDDFFWKRDGRMHVREAVIDAMAACGINRKSAFSRIGQQFMIKVEKVTA